MTSTYLTEFNIEDQDVMRDLNYIFTVSLGSNYRRRKTFQLGIVSSGLHDMSWAPSDGLVALDP